MAKLHGFGSPLIHSLLMSGAHGTRIRSAGVRPGAQQAKVHQDVCDGEQAIPRMCHGCSRMPPPKRNISWFRTRRLTVRFMVDILPLDVFINQIINEDPYMPLLFAYPNTMLLVGWAHRCEAVSEHLRWEVQTALKPLNRRVGALSLDTPT